VRWSSTPEEAFQRCLYLNNKYELDGRDPGGFAGVGWCFGNIRYMSADGLKRKSDAGKYAKKYL